MSGTINLESARTILARARAAGMDTLDTAIAYGHSEETLGRIGVGDWRVISKLPPFPAACPALLPWSSSEVEGSLRRLGVSRLGGLLLHRPAQLSGPRGDELYAALRSLRDRGLIEKIGVSIYDPAELAPLVDRYALDLVQAPFNLFDQRLVRSGWLSRLQDAGIELHVRSIFLQGLLLMDKDCRPRYFQRWDAQWALLENWLATEGATPLEACLQFVLGRPEIARVVVGVDGPEQLEQILEAAAGVLNVPEALASDDLDLLDPSRWPSQ